MYPQRQIADTYKVDSGKQVRKTEVLIAGGGIGGSALFRYFAEAGKRPCLLMRIEDHHGVISVVVVQRSRSPN